jgi:NhaA family Na+:H+ antiporter
LYSHKFNWYEGLNHSNTLGIMLGLVIGKPLGIWLFSFVAVTLGICTLPKDLK